MKPKKKSRPAEASASMSGLDLAISRFIYSFGLSKQVRLIQPATI